MGICPWGFTLVTVALLLDPTFADIQVQPGYEPQGQVTKNSVSQSQFTKHQTTGGVQQNYLGSQNPRVQQLQQQHVAQQQQLQNLHQQEHNQLLQLQHQQLQDPTMQQYQNGGGEMVGSIWGIPRMPTMFPGAFTGLNGGRVVSLGPLGLQSFTLGGLNGLAPPLLLSPHQPSEMTGSDQFQKSMGGATQSRARRDVRDPGELAGRKQLRQKTSRPQQDGVATNPSVKSTSEAASSDTQSSKTNSEGMVGDILKTQNAQENVGSSGSLLDPLGLVDKAEGMMEDLKHGHLPNPLESLRDGLLPGGRPWLGKTAGAGNPQFNEHIVGQSQQQYDQYPNQGQSNMPYNMANQQRMQSQQAPGQIVGRSRQMPNSYLPQQPGSWPARSSASPYPGMQPSPYSSYGDAGRSWLGRSMGNQANGMGYVGAPMSRQWQASPNSYEAMNGPMNPAKIGAPNQHSRMQSNFYNSPNSDPMTGAGNPAIHEHIVRPSGPNMNNFEKMVGAQQTAGTPNSPGQPRASSMNNPVLGAPNPGNYNPMTGAPNPSNVMSAVARVAQPMMDSFMGGTSPFNHPQGMMGDGRSMGEGNGMYTGMSSQANQYGGGQRSFDLEDLFDGGFNNHHHHHHHNHNGFNLYDDRPYGYGGGGYPFHIHNQESYVY